MLDLLDDLCCIFEFRRSICGRGTCRGCNDDIMIFFFRIFYGILILVVLLRLVSDEKAISCFCRLLAHLFEFGERVLNLLAFTVFLRLIFYENGMINGIGSYIRPLHHQFSSSDWRHREAWCDWLFVRYMLISLFRASCLLILSFFTFHLLIELHCEIFFFFGRTL